MTYKPFDFTKYRTQRQGHWIEINLDEIFGAIAAHECVLKANPTLLREALQDLMRELLDLAKRPEPDPQLQFDRVCEIEWRFERLVEMETSPSPAATEGIPPGLICPPDDEPPPFTLTHGGS
jgi:hypothetical protein